MALAVSSAITVAVPAFGILFHLVTAYVLRHLVRHNSYDGPDASLRCTRVTNFMWKALSFLKTNALVNRWALLIYSLSRGFIVIEVFRSLAFQPPGTFQTSWPANLPDIGWDQPNGGPEKKKGISGPRANFGIGLPGRAGVETAPCRGRTISKGVKRLTLICRRRGVNGDTV